jgi:hypothetical protein
MAAIDGKVSQRLRQGRRKYHIRINGCQPGDISGRRALSCVGEYLQGKKAMVEWFVFVRTRDTLAEFFNLAPSTDVPADQFDSYRERFQPVVQSLLIP